MRVTLNFHATVNYTCSWKCKGRGSKQRKIKRDGIGHGEQIAYLIVGQPSAE